MLKKLFLTTAIFISLTACSTVDYILFTPIDEMISPERAEKRKEQEAKDKANGIVIVKRQSGENDESYEQRQNVAKKRNYWMGKGYTIDQLVASWGTPSGTYDRADGSKQYTWKHIQYSTREIPQLFGSITKRYEHTCITNFFADQDGKLIEWNASGCVN